MAKKGFVVHHNGPPANCVGATHSRCIAFWEAVKRYHMQSNGWSDIAYSFGVCPHGVRFTGRGWFKNQFANGKDEVGVDDGKDSEWFTVLVFLGGDEKPTPEMIEGVKNLIIDGRSLGRCGMRVLPHNAFKRKACPGPEFTALSAVWDNNPTLAVGGIKDWFDMATKAELADVVQAEGHATRKWIREELARFGAVLTKEIRANGGDAVDVDAKELAERIVNELGGRLSAAKPT